MCEDIADEEEEGEVKVEEEVEGAGSDLSSSILRNFVEKLAFSPELASMLYIKVVLFSHQRRLGQR